MDCIVHGVAKSRTRLSDFHFTSFRMYSVSTSRLKTTAPSLTILCIHAKSLQSDSLQPYGLSLPGSSVHGILQARILAWVAISLLKGIFPTQGLNSGLLHCRQILYHLNHQGSPVFWGELLKTHVLLVKD